MIYYFTGQPGSGKTTIGKLLKEYLSLKDPVFHIDGDDIREITKNQNYGKEGRYQNIQTTHNIAKYLDKQNYDVVISLVAPYFDIRDELKNKIEIYIHCNEIRGREQFHVIDYEKPTKDFIDLDTTNKTIDDSFNELLLKLNLK